MSNPYELRFRLLEMAQGYLQDEQEKQRNFAIDAWEFAKEQGTANMKVFEDLQPESYSIEDIKKKATELYEFVEKQLLTSLGSHLGTEELPSTTMLV